MSEIDLPALAEMAERATPAPWYVGHFDDEHCMSAVSIEAYPGSSNQVGSEVIAATLIQQPRYVDPSDQKWSENAGLIVEMRNALPELLRLASIGQASERKA